ncbi:hypothetical protein VPH35_019699 [Triticum aestivum]
MASPVLISDTDQWKALQAHVGAIHKTHLRDLMTDIDRCKAMTAEFEGAFLDYSRQQATTETIDKLFKLAEAAKLKEKIDKLFKTFRTGSWIGATGKPLTNVVSVGIGGSLLGPLFVHTALQTDPEAA